MRGYDAASYGEGMAEVYDDWFDDLGDVDTITATLAALTPPGADVLELGVGTGRLAIPLAARLASTGGTVHGLDTSPAMLDRLRAKPGGAAIQLHQGDMATAIPAGPFGLVFVAYNTLFAVDAEEQSVLLRAVAAALGPGGRFLVEAFVPAADRRAGGAVEVRSIDADRVVLNVSRHDPANQEAEGNYIDITAAGIRLRPWRVLYRTPEQVDRAAEAAGLILEARWAGWRREPYDDDAVTHVSVYRAPDGER